jgi:hypothetical protein
MVPGSLNSAAGAGVVLVRARVAQFVKIKGLRIIFETN